MKVPVLVAAGGAAWESSALRVIDDAAPRLVLLRRCIDLSDLLASAGTGTASVAVVGSDVVGLDADTVASLRRHGVSVVVVRTPQSDPDRLTRLGIDHQLEADALDQLPGVLEGVAPHVLPQPQDDQDVPDPIHPGEIIAVWGPAGAPGRTTVAVGLAAELAHRGRGTLLLDADPYGGAVAQHLGVLDQVSGLLAGARLANSGQLDAGKLAAVARRVHDRLRVLSGLPRADRWVEVRAQAFANLLRVAATLEPHVVVDTGFCLEQDADAFSTATGRNALTLTTLEHADHLVVVGAADPVGLARLVRGLHDLADLVPGRVPVVVINRMRGSLGWSDRDVAAMVNSAVPGSPVHFLPDDRPAADKALMAGWSLVESGDSALRKAIAELAQALSSRYNPVTV
jgi:MinD-like ATPase involved in chromosome partitioning or flagellar assembly